MIKKLMLFTVLLLNIAAHAEENHSGHSDDLLLLLKDKIALQTLIKQYEKAQGESRQNNEIEQGRILQRALTRLKRYVAIPENHYPNLDMYQQSLVSRAALMQDFATLMWQSQCLHTQACDSSQ